MLVRTKKLINVEVDSRMLAIQSQKEVEEQEQLEEHDSCYIPTLLDEYFNTEFLYLIK